VKPEEAPKMAALMRECAELIQSEYITDEWLCANRDTIVKLLSDSASWIDGLHARAFGKKH